MGENQLLLLPCALSKTWSSAVVRCLQTQSAKSGAEGECKTDAKRFHYDDEIWSCGNNARKARWKPVKVFASSQNIGKEDCCWLILTPSSAWSRRWVWVFIFLNIWSHTSVEKCGDDDDGMHSTARCLLQCSAVVWGSSVLQYQSVISITAVSCKQLYPGFWELCSNIHIWM